MVMNVELIMPRLVDVDKLVPYEKNARVHEPEKVAAVMESIKEFGWTNPILLGKDNVILAGHKRRLAALGLRIKRVPCIDIGHLTEEQQRTYIIADNQHTLSSHWDMEVLKVELLELGAAGVDLEMTGFTLDEIDNIVNPEPPDPEPEPKGDDDRPTCPHCGQKYNEQT